MSLPGEPPPDPVPQRRTGRPWERPDTEVPAVVPVGTLRFDTTGPTAVAVTGLLAYSNGFEFFVTRLVRPEGPGSLSGRRPRAPDPGGFLRAGESFKLGVEFAERGQALSGGPAEPRHDDEPGRPFLHGGRGFTRGHREDRRWWVWPLPPPGRLDFICQLGGAETRVSMDAQLILDASRRSVQAWPSA